jgi:hypothetical protein
MRLSSFLIGDSEREDLLLGQLGKAFHVGLDVHGRAHSTLRSLRLQRGDLSVSRQRAKVETDLSTASHDAGAGIRDCSLRPLDSFTKSMLRFSIVGYDRAAMRYWRLMSPGFAR